MILTPVTSGGVGDIEKIAELIGVYDGSNRDFTMPEGAIHDPPNRHIKLYHGGRRLNLWEYTATESVSGSGSFDKIRMNWAPSPTSRLVTDYFPA